MVSWVGHQPRAGAGRVLGAGTVVAACLKGHQKTMHSEIKCIIKEESEKVLIKILNHCTLVFSSALLFVKHKNNMHKIRKCSWNLRNITNEKLIRGEDLIE